MTATPAPGPALLAQALSHQKAGRNAEAAMAYRAALDAGENAPELHHNLGVALRLTGDMPGAIDAFRTAIALRPGYARSALALASLLRATGRPAEGAEVLEAAFAATPDDTLRDEAARAWTEAGRPDRAHPHLLAAHQAAPDDPYRRSALGNALMALGCPTEAVPHHAAVAAALADRADAKVNHGLALMQSGDAAAAFAVQRAALRQDARCQPAWNNLLLTAHYMPELTAQQVTALHRDHARLFPAAPVPEFPNTRDPARRLRIGLVSGDLRDHPVGYFLEAALMAHDRHGFAFFAYSNHATEDATSARLRTACEAWHRVATLDDAALEARIRGDAIDILVDLAGHTQGTRQAVFERRPAPVQAGWIGYASTSGCAAMDWIIADAVGIPPDEEALYTERVLRLPGSYLCFTPPAFDVPRTPPPMLTRGHVTFGCFNNPAKLNPRVLRAWARILAGLPDARLLLKARPFGEPATAAAMRARFAAAGGDASRLDFEAHHPRRAYFARYCAVDMMLDPFPFPGATTTAEAIHAGVPTITLKGRGGLMSHNGESLLTAIGLPDWIARDEDDYVAQAVRRARDPQALAALRARLALGPLADGARYARGLEAAWRTMWRDWCEGPVSAVRGSPEPPH